MKISKERAMAEILYPYKKITSAKNEYISETAKLKDKKYRDRTGLFLIEGKKLFSELLSFAINDSVEITGVILTEENIDFLNSSAEFREYYYSGKNKFLIILTEEAVISKLTSEKSPQGIVCVVKKFDRIRHLDYNLPVVILDRIQNPGNLGGIMRTMNALGRFNLILTGNCADIYSEKALRAAMGAVFHQNIVYMEDTPAGLSFSINELRREGYKIYATYLSGEAVSIDKIVFGAKTAVIFGSEGSGLDESVPAMCDRNVLIPIRESAESLNIAAAAAIFLWKIKNDISLQTDGL